MFERRGKAKEPDATVDPDVLFHKIGQLTMERDFLQEKPVALDQSNKNKR